MGMIVLHERAICLNLLKLDYEDDDKDTSELLISEEDEAVQPSSQAAQPGKSMGMMVLQERAKCLNLTNLSNREKEGIFNMPIVP